MSKKAREKEKARRRQKFDHKNREKKSADYLRPGPKPKDNVASPQSTDTDIDNAPRMDFWGFASRRYGYDEPKPLTNKQKKRRHMAEQRRKQGENADADNSGVNAPEPTAPRSAWERANARLDAELPHRRRTTNDPFLKDLERRWDEDERRANQYSPTEQDGPDTDENRPSWPPFLF